MENQPASQPNETDPIFEGLKNYYVDNGFSLRGVDVFCLGPQRPSNAIGRLLGILTAARDSESARSIFSGIYFAYPKWAMGADTVVALRDRIVSELSRVPDVVPVGSTPENWIHLTPLDLRSELLLDFASGLPSRSVLVVLEATDFRFHGLEVEEARVPEDIWAPHLYRLASALLKISEERTLPVILECGQFLPSREQHRDLLQSLEGVGLMGADAVVADSDVAANIRKWDSLVADGRIGAVLDEVEAAEGWSSEEREVYRVQILHRATLFSQAIEEIEKLKNVAGLAANLQVKLGRIAADAGARMLAKRLLSSALPRLTTVDDLVAAILAARELDDDQIVELGAARLGEIFPGHRLLTSVRRLRMRSEAKFIELADELEPIDAVGSAYYRRLAEVLTDVTSHGEALASLDEAYPERREESLFLVVKHALQGRRFEEATAVVLGSTSLEPSHVSLLLDMLERLLLKQQDDADRELILAALHGVIEFLSARPAEAGLRVRLEQLLSFEVAGLAGVAYLAFVIQELLSAPLNVSPSDLPLAATTDPDFALSQLEPAIAWLNETRAFMLGVATVPRELIAGDPDKLAASLIDLMAYTASRMAHPDDVKSLDLQLTLVTSINPHTVRGTYDLLAARYAGGGYVSAGQSQRARDLAEQALRFADADDSRRRLGWVTYADLYLRSGKRLESIVGFAAAAATGAKLDGESAWSEMNGLARVFRELGLFPHARYAHERAAAILTRMGLEHENAERTELLALSIDFMEAASSKTVSSELVGELLDRAINCALAASSDHPDPALVLLAQVIPFAESKGVEVGKPAFDALEALVPKASRRATILTRGFVSHRADPAALFELHAMQQSARFADDAGFDARFTGLLAQRMLWNCGEQLDPVVATFFVELLADRAIPPPGWEVTARPLAPLKTIEEAATIAARESSRRAVLVIALDSRNRLVRVDWEQGSGRVLIEPAATFSADAFSEWRETFPYRYGVDDGATANLFFTSTERIRLSHLPPGPILVVADSSLQLLPINLLRVGDDFAGQAHPMSSVPSLSWLNESRVNPARSNGRLRGWISSRTDEGHTLAMVAARLEETFLKHGVELNQSDSLPSDLAGSELVIVTAHGSLGESSQFQRVRDEGDLVVSSSDMALALRNVRLVILFVCSAGRADQIPGAVSTAGLARQMLQKGASAVVASPWPLDSRVTYHWLPRFMDEWTSGSSLDEAVFAANASVADAMGFSPATALALSVFGDPALRFQGFDE